MTQNFVLQNKDVGEIMDLLLDPTRKQVLTHELRSRLEKGVDLPVLPNLAHELIRLRNQPTADVSELVNIIAKDPVVSAQIMRHGRMSIYGYGERIQSLDDAIQLVLGYEKALHLALGLSAGKSLRIEIGGPLGARKTWQHSLKCALLSQNLAKELPANVRPNLGLTYLAGLMHDIGFLLFGVLYPQEFSILNGTIEKYGHVNSRELEFHAVGITHDLIGSLLFRNWNLPEEVIIATAEHHFPDYDGRHAIFAKLVYLANQLSYGNDEAIYSAKTSAVFNELGLDDAAIKRVLASLDEMGAEFDAMVEDMVA